MATPTARSDRHCQLWLPKKNRFCANPPLHDSSSFCGNHTARSNQQWIPCPIDPSHSVLEDNLQNHLTKCPLHKRALSLSLQPYYQKGINAGTEGGGGEEEEEPAAPVTSKLKRRSIHNKTLFGFFDLIRKIKSIHASVVACQDIQDSFKIPDACAIWTDRLVDQKLPFQEKHAWQQASILGNMEQYGILEKSGVGDAHSKFGQANAFQHCHREIPAVVEFGAGRGYLTQMLADCYGIKKVLLVERKSYKLKADRSLRQIQSLRLERLRIDIEDLNLNAVESLEGVSYLAIGKHLCGPATDKNFMSNLGVTKEDFHAMTWFTSWAVDTDREFDLGDIDGSQHLKFIEKNEFGADLEESEVGDVIRQMSGEDRAVLGLMCKDIIDVGRLTWLKEQGLDSQMVKYVPPSISPENHLLLVATT